jgi:hypothetical protein
MLVKSVSRQEFLDLLQARGTIERYDVHSTDWIDPPSRHADEIQLIWSDEDLATRSDRDKQELPTIPRIVVLASEKKRDFLAWVWTYLPEFRPFTAYARVLGGDEVKSQLGLKGTPRLGDLEEACLGLILGEAATYVENTHDKKVSVTPLACASTYSYAMARAVALGWNEVSAIERMDIPNTWMKARSLTRQRPLRLDLSDLSLPWRLLLDLCGKEKGHQYSSRGISENIYDACMNLYRETEVNPETWDLLSRGYPHLREARKEMQGPREGRVVFFERFVLSLADISKGDSVSASFLCGFLASQIGPGTLDYISLLAPHLDRFPTTLLWYGLCSGLQHRSSLYGFSSGLGRRILREVLRKETLFDAPQSDIALSELEALTSNDTMAMEFRTWAQGVMAIEIAPLIASAVRWPPKQADQVELFSTDTNSFELQELTTQLDDLRGRMVQVQKRISRFVDARESSDWKAPKGRKK